MVPGVIEQIFETLLALTLGMARIYPCLFLVPIFAFKELKGMLRHAIVLALALVPMPGIQYALTGAEHSWTWLVGLIFKEVVLGILLGLLLAMPFWLFESVGALFDNQRGALTGGQLNPALGQDVTPLGHLLKQVFTLLLIIGLGYGVITQVIWDSYLLWPPTLWLPQPAADGFDVYLGLLADTFSHMVLYAAPLVGLLLMLDFSVAILSLYSQHLQVSSLSMPAKCLVGIAFLLIYLPMLEYLADGRLLLFRDMPHILPLLLSAP
jgi:type III secretion protein T